MATDDNDLLWRQISRIGTCMMITRDGDDIRARPMAGTADRENNVVWFIANRSQHKDEEIGRDPRVCLAYVDTGENTYVSISGRAEVLEDRSRMKALWTPAIDAWFREGPDDPEAILIAVRPEFGEYWDNPSSDLVVALRMLTTSGRTGETPRVGENRKVDL